MASIRQDPDYVVFRIHCRYGGDQYQKSLKTTDPKEAEAKKGVVEHTLKAIHDGWLTVPPDADLWLFLQSGGRVESRPTGEATADESVLTLDAMFDAYVKKLPEGTLEENSLATRELHFSHLKRLLAHVQEHTRFSFIYPMFVIVAHIGARRSEMRRSQVHEIDFDNNCVELREKKRDTSKESTARRVPMSSMLRQVMEEWLAVHPGGSYAFCQGTTRMKKREQAVPLTPKMADHHFGKPLEDSRWKVVSGFHVLRHSFASNLAAKGVDQRLIDEWMGHQTEEMRERYRHLHPDQAKAAIDLVYG